MRNLFLALALFWAPAVWAVGASDYIDLSPYWDWKTIETEHFRLSFPVELTDVAMKSANYFEESHAILSPRLHWTPHYKVQVLILDNTDAANGLTTPIGRFGMALMVTPPENWFSTGYYDDWLRLLIIHEYTHFLNMDATSDFYAVLRYIFGDVLLPNTIWPTWMIEGLAVYMETRFTKAGRGRSPYYEMILRSAVDAGVLDTDQFITLDKINGTNPYFPGGETPYLFGYQLMHQVAKQKPSEQEAVLGQMSERSSARLPFLINGNLEKITGRDWYHYWREWVQETKERATEQLSRIKSQPLTQFEELTDNGYQTLGSAASPDGLWIAYTGDSSDRRMGLYLRNLLNNKTRRIADKYMGSTVAFTPDSQSLVFSMLHKMKQYYLFSDLAVYNIKNNSIDWLTERLRARDPDVSRDGSKLVFTVTDKSTTALAIAPLILKDGEYSLGQVDRLYTPSQYDRVSTPKFSADGKKVIFSVHHNGHPSEDLVELDISTKKLLPLVTDGKFNRFPAISPEGDIYFVSDATGVDNLYRYRSGSSELLTNVVGGVAFPTFGPAALYAGVFSYRGWNLAKMDLTASASISAKDVTIDPAPAPPADEHSIPNLSEKDYPVSDYSIFPSIWPRQWFPYFALQPDSAYLGAQLLGFDAVDRHRYYLSGGYDTQTQKPDWSVTYVNRSFGPTLSLSGSNQTAALLVTTSGLDYLRKLQFQAALAYPILWTYSSLTPSVSAKIERTFEFQPGANPSDDDIVSRSRYVPSLDGVLTFSSTERSRLAISAEGGRRTQLGARVYFDSGQETWKGLFLDTEHFRVTDHSVLVPSLKASWAPRWSYTYSAANVVVGGRLPKVMDSILDDDFDQLSIRGYPGRAYYSQAAVVGSLDYRFPILRIFRGSGTNPAFLENLYGYVFGESTYFPDQDSFPATLPSAGGGIKASSRLLIQIPLTLALEYHQGFREDFGGTGELFFQLAVEGLQF